MDLLTIFIAIAFIVLAFRLIKHIINRNKRKEDKFLKSIDYSARIPVVKTKPKSGKRRTKEEIQADSDCYEKKLGDEFRKRAKATMIQAKRVGSTGYIWHSGGCNDECDRNDGKKFKWDKPPKTGHPGEGALCKNGYCRCWEEVIIPPPSK
ncbi:hypothetical protein [Serratia liquefaciens]|uniref:hypothetical protein n=1 Tax=Serratia liquefaciens TaxID=614 RepID=UPI0039B0585B